MLHAATIQAGGSKKGGNLDGQERKKKGNERGESELTWSIRDSKVENLPGLDDGVQGVHDLGDRSGPVPPKDEEGMKERERESATRRDDGLFDERATHQ